MTKQMKVFLSELADLMEKHNVEAEITEEENGYYNCIEGLEFSMESLYDDEKGVRIRDYCDYNVGTFLRADLIRKFDIEEK